MAEQDAGSTPQPRYLEDMFAQQKPAEPKYLEDMFAARNKDVPSISPTLGTPFGPIVRFFSPDPGEAWGDYMNTAPAGRVMSAYVGDSSAWGATPEMDDTLRKIGVYQPYADQQSDLHHGFLAGVMRPLVTSMRGFNEALLRPVLATGQAAFHAIGQIPEAAAQFGREEFGPDVGRALGAAAEFTTQGMPGVVHVHPLPAPVAKSRAAAVIGEGEHGYFGTREPTEAEVGQQVAAASQVAQEAPTREPAPPPEPAAEAPPATPAGPTVDDLARQARPDLFKEWDALDGRRQDYRRWLDDLAEKRDQRLMAEGHPDVADIDRQIAENERKLENAGNRTRPKFEAALDDLHAQRAEVLGRISETDDADMTLVRSKLQEADFRMRDLAPEVAAALREAEALVPKPEQVATSETVAPAAPAAEKTQAEEPVSAGPEAPKPDEAVAAPTADAQRQYIIDDLTAKLQGVGRDAEVARAEAAIVANMYETYADLWGGKLGSARELYDREAPAITLGGRKAARRRERELAQPAYHGSPHIFDQFTLDHIGEGEGAQAYGHGLYFASNKAVAKYYRNALVGADDRVRMTPEVKEALRHFDYLGFDTAGEAMTAIRTHADWERNWDVVARKAGDAEAIAEIKSHLEKVPKSGRLYHVDLAPEAHEWLDWDKKFSEQSPQVQERIEKVPAFRKLVEDKDREFGKGYGRKWVDEVSGGTIYHEIGRRLADQSEPPGNGWTSFRQTINDRVTNPRATSGALHAAGVPGVRYLDQGSRGAQGTGTHNFVVFSPDDVTIKEFEQRDRGKITFTDQGRNIIRLMAKADASTFMHETSHDWLERLVRDAKREDASEQLKKDVAAIHSWLGTKDAETVPTKAHEKFARGWERYLMEGRAPSKALADVFAKFRQWLTAIYESVTRLRSPITDDIRDIFDRLIVKNPERQPVLGELTERSGGLGDVHAAEGAETATEHGETVGDRMHDERARDIVGTREPDLAGELGIDRGAEAGTGAASRAGADGGGAAAGPDGGAAAPGAPVGEVGAGRGVPPPSPPKPVHLYLKVPKQPLTLASFLKKAGGVDPKYEGELAAVVGKDAAKKLVNAKTGKPLDDLTLSAWESGYFPENYMAQQHEGAELSERPEPTDLLRRLDDDRRTPVYSEHDADKVAAYENAVNHNADVDRLAAKYGIDTSKVYLGQFWEMVGERESVEALDAEIASKGGDAIDALRAFDDVLERSDPDWQPPAERSLEDLERERKQEEAAQRAGQGQGGAGGSVPPAAGEGSGEGGVRPDVGGAGAAGRQDVQAAEAGASPGRATGTGPRAAQERGSDGGSAGTGRAFDPFGATDSELVEKAGNIRLELLRTPADVNSVLQQIGRDNNFFEDRRFGEEGEGLYRQVISTRILLKQAADDYLGKSRAVAALTDEEMAGKMDAEGASVEHPALEEMREAGDRLAMIQGELSVLTHQWGRAGQAFRDMNGLPGIPESRTLAQWASRSRTLSQSDLRREASLVGRLDSPRQRARFLQQSRESLYSRGRAMYIEYFVNNLISGPITHSAYLVGNAVYALAKAVPETYTSAAISALRGDTGADRIYFGEAHAQLFGMMKGAFDGWDAAARAWKTGVSELLPGEVAPGLFGPEPVNGRHFERQTAIPGKFGEAIRLPSDAVAAIHSFGRSIGYAQELWRQAYRAAAAEGLEGAARDRAIAAFVAHPPEAVMVQAAQEATRMVMMNRSKYNSAFYNLKKVAERNVIAKTIMPFMQIGANLTREAFLEHTAVGFADETIRDNIMGRNGKSAQAMQAGKWVVGSTLVAGTVMGVMGGIISGAGPTDADERRELMSKGWQPYSVKLGDRWVPYRKLIGPFGMLVGAAANIGEGVEMMSDGDIRGGISAATWGLGEVIMDESWFRGISDFVAAVRNYDKPEGERYWENLATDFIPYSVGLSQVARLVDSQARLADTFLERVQAHIPFGTQGLLPRRDIFGDPLPSRVAVSPSIESKDPAFGAMEAVGFYPSSVPKSIRGVKLTDQQHDDFSRVSGRYFRMRVDAMVTQPTWGQIPGHIRYQMMHQALHSAREMARAAVMAGSRGTEHDIEQQARERKLEDQAYRDDQDAETAPHARR